MYQHNDHTKLYIVSFANFGTNSIDIKQIYADSEKYAMLDYLKSTNWVITSVDYEKLTISNIKQIVREGDCLIEVQEAI